MENDHIILNVDSDNRRIELNLFKESTIIEIIDELIDKKEIIIEKILEIFNDKNNNYEANLVYIDIIGKVFNDNERSVIEKTLKVGMENLLSNIIIEFVDTEKYFKYKIYKTFYKIWDKRRIFRKCCIIRRLK